jgi:hypothetical protein
VGIADASAIARQSTPTKVSPPPGANAMSAATSPTPSQLPAPLASLFEEVAQAVRGAGVFGEVAVSKGILECAAKASAAPASFRLGLDGGKVWVSLVTADRWLSQSIEADLVHTGDKLEDLLAEELADLDYTGPALPFEHFRSEDKLFTFRSPIPVDVSKPGVDAARTASTCLLAYEACFRRLGDMDAPAED